ncbi:hypothetical protein SUGI_1036890 [Cryptomeria japonica]|nr:hypothetical protein SUGI_1036890 [Cryptomeria japonica]
MVLCCQRPCKREVEMEFESNGIAKEQKSQLTRPKIQWGGEHFARALQEETCLFEDCLKKLVHLSFNFSTSATSRRLSRDKFQDMD